MTEAEKRDFISSIIELASLQKEVLANAGFCSDTLIETLRKEKEEADKAEILQKEAMAASQIATKQSQEALAKAYNQASNMAEIISGLLGRDNELVKKMRKFRK
ncbi:MAG: hypothetical protein JXR91_13840 [Deltaproteobacteria bacterium]|nr:hypothetical protein [Deltaproteobacteria bacterium]